MESDRRSDPIAPDGDSRRGAVFVGVARSCAHALPGLLQVVAEAGSALEDWAYIFLESDSSDDTFDLLTRFDSRHGCGIVETYGTLRRRLRLRTARLAYLRNEALRRIRSSGWDRRFRHCVVLDMDAANHELKARDLVEAMASSDGSWAGLFPNQSQRYYDVWALRHPELSPDDCWQRVWNRPAGMSRDEAERRFVHSRMVVIPPDSDRIEVDSAFGGLAIYEMEWLDGCSYDGLASDGSQVCEHVAFNACIRAKGGRLFVEPGLINGSGVRPHKPSRWRRLLGWLRRKVGS